MATVLRDAGWSTYWVGKNHNVPVDEWSMGASKKDWPLGQGYDRFYGFIGGETNNWYPDLADQVLRFIRDSKQSEPDKR
jgi:arylsulfatase